MPYFSWQGITLQGTLRTGKSYAQSVDELDAHLLRRDIALLASKKIRAQRFVRPPSMALKIKLFRQLATLLNAGVLLPQALTLVAQQIDHPRLQEVVAAITTDVHHGVSLSKAVGTYPALFSPLMVQMIYVGQEAGSLDHALHALCDYLEDRQNFYRQIRSAALMPAITFGFFVVIVAAIFIGIIPYFVDIFTAMGHELPPLTRAMVTISRYMTNPVLMGLLVIVLGTFWYMTTLYSRLTSGRRMVDGLYVRMPVINTLIIDSSIGQFARCAALLLEAGLPLLKAVTIAKKSVHNLALQEQFAYLEHELEAGVSLGQALAQHPEQLFDHTMVAMVSVAQEATHMSAMLRRVATEYQTKVNRRLTVITTLFQPLLMIILGLLVMLLIFAVYIPLMNMSHMVR